MKKKLPVMTTAPRDVVSSLPDAVQIDLVDIAATLREGMLSIEGIQTCLRSWVYGRLYESSDERNAALSSWLHYYNHERKHRGIDRLTPMAKLVQLQAVDAEQCA